MEDDKRKKQKEKEAKDAWVKLFCFYKILFESLRSIWLLRSCICSKYASVLAADHVQITADLPFLLRNSWINNWEYRGWKCWIYFPAWTSLSFSSLNSVLEVLGELHVSVDVFKQLWSKVRWRDQELQSVWPWWCWRSNERCTRQCHQ